LNGCTASSHFETKNVEWIVIDWFGLGRRSGFEADSSESHIEDVLFGCLGGRLRGLHHWRDIDYAVEDIVIHDVLDFLWLLDYPWLFNDSRSFRLFLLGCWVLSLGGWFFLGDMIIVVDNAGSWHFEGPNIEVHICFSNGNVLEGIDSGLEGRHCDADLLLSIGIPSVFEEFRILAGSLLYLEVRVGLEASDHLDDSFTVAEFFIQLQKSGKTIGDCIVGNTHLKDDTFDQIQDIFFSDGNFLQSE
jgi:hypothetical protein